jgi:hypothetical protein
MKRVGVALVVVGERFAAATTMVLLWLLDWEVNVLVSKICRILKKSEDTSPTDPALKGIEVIHPRTPAF